MHPCTPRWKFINCVVKQALIFGKSSPGIFFSVPQIDYFSIFFRTKQCNSKSAFPQTVPDALGCICCFITWIKGVAAKLQMTTQAHSAKNQSAEERGEIKEKMGMNCTEIAELHNDQPGFIFIEQTHIQLSSSRCRSGRTRAHQTLFLEGVIKYFWGLSTEGPSSVMEWTLCGAQFSVFPVNGKSWHLKQSWGGIEVFNSKVAGPKMRQSQFIFQTPHGLGPLDRIQWLWRLWDFGAECFKLPVFEEVLESDPSVSSVLVQPLVCSIK